MDKELLEKKVTRDELGSFFATDRSVSLVLNGAARFQDYNAFMNGKREGLFNIKDLTVRNRYDFFTKGTQRSWAHKNMGRQSMSGLDRWARSLELEQTPYFLKHLPIVGEEPVPIELGRLRLDNWENKSSLAPYTFVAGLEMVDDIPTNLVYWNTENPLNTYYNELEKNPKHVNINEIFDYVRNNGASGDKAVRNIVFLQEKL